MNKFLLISSVLISAWSVIADPSIALAQSDEDSKFLLMYFKQEDLVVESATRSRKPLTQVAENITVVSADEIKLMNAHTVADVLNSITGVQVLMTGAPGSIAQVSIQGSENRHVAVFMDGIPLNNVGDNIVDIGAIPVQYIEKIEIIKGPASSTWGSALGGVINIVTKTGTSYDHPGLISVSYGEKNTGDFRIETSGKEDLVGYYFSAGRLQTDGFRPHNDFAGENAFAKVTYDITNTTQLLLSTSYDTFERGIADLPDLTPPLFFNNDVTIVKSLLSLKSSLNKETELNLSLWRLDQHYDVHNFDASTGMEVSKNTYRDEGYGSSVRMNWKHQGQNVVLGADLDSKQFESNTIEGNTHALRKYAYYINDTISFSRFSVTPGFRHDETNTNDGMTSPSLGMTYKLADTALLRAYAARGFSIPPLAYTFGDNQSHIPNPDLKMERVRSYQAGGETTAVPYLWMKLDLFRHDITDVIAPNDSAMEVNGGKARRQGFELELKTRPVYNTSLSAGASVMSAKKEDGQTIPNTPQRTYDVGLQYDDNSLKAQLRGHYIHWNTEVSNGGKYNSMIFDLHAAQKIYSRSERTLELFFDIHNIFNGEQYPLSLYKNPPRWLEAGLRYAF